MNVQKMSCPNCGASISVTEELDQLNCVYCGSLLSVQRGEGYAALKAAEKLGQAIQDSSVQTQGTIRDGTYITQVELKRLQINQDMTTAHLQLSNIQTEVRTLEREKATRKTKQQLRELRQQEASLKSRIALLQAALQPGGAANGVDNALLSAAPVPQRKPWNRSFGCMTLLFFFLPPVWAVVILGDKEQSTFAKVFAGMLLVLFVITFFAVLVSQN